ncbi:DNA repair protein [Candidatus Enterovibrio altilux]|uniref:ATPase involved in DNA repair n=1 Tax=Candidatus Enterovibrio altilux TaxID=1927128 RepID=A0A291B6N5_9GAMM|nr:DNA repair protein [Candidatus Enterovibrio luxaltus]ATF08669.1 ATPase involved in DNA repair [Candidatus Enterovibrio luxaltus]
MNISLIAVLCVLLFGLIVGYNIMAQYRQRLESSKRQEMAKYIAVIDTTEELIGNAHNLPFSGSLLVCLNNKILDALKTMHDIDRSDRSLEQRIVDVQGQIKQIQHAYQNQDSTSFRVSDSDREAISMLKLVKRLRAVIKAEHTKGRMLTQLFVAENLRLEQMQVKINIENVLKRVNDARIKGQLGTAQQLIKKAIEVVSSKNNAYCQSAKESLNEMLDEVNQALNKGHESAKSRATDNKELDELFAPKKKW